MQVQTCTNHTVHNVEIPTSRCESQQQISHTTTLRDNLYHIFAPPWHYLDNVEITISIDNNVSKC